MNIRARRTTTAVAAAAAAAATLVVLPPAQSATLARSQLTVHATDRTPASAQPFRLLGAVTSKGKGVSATVSVKTLSHGHWVQLSGASVHTNRSHQYRVRINLWRKGKRQLRVVADPSSPRIATSWRTITVTVH